VHVLYMRKHIRSLLQSWVGVSETFKIAIPENFIFEVRLSSQSTFMANARHRCDTRNAHAKHEMETFTYSLKSVWTTLTAEMSHLSMLRSCAMPTKGCDLGVSLKTDRMQVSSKFVNAAMSECASTSGSNGLSGSHLWHRQHTNVQRMTRMNLN
jgi:Sec7-like guanine-nucleotide exchange factor